MAGKGERIDEETRAKMSAARRAWWARLSPEEREHISAGRKGRKPSREAIEKMKATWREKGYPMQGKKLRPETRRKLSAALKGRPSPMKGRRHRPESKARMSAAKKGKRPGAETRRRMSVAQKRRAERGRRAGKTRGAKKKGLVKRAVAALLKGAGKVMP